MTEGKDKPRRKLPYVQAAIGLLVLAAFIGAALYLTSPRFNEAVRARIISELEDATGGRVELGELNWNLSRLRLEALNLTIHGLEGPNELPYAHVDRLFLRAKVGSLFNRHFGLRYLELDHPVIHLIVNSDGSTNQPKPKPKGNGTSVQTLFNLAVNRAVIKDGVLIINDRPIPLELSASDVAAGVSYVPSAKRYDGKIHLGKIETKLKDLRPFSAISDAEFSLFPDAVQLKTLTIMSGKSRLEASGTLEDFAHPKLTLNYRSTVDLAQAGAIARIPQVRGGELNVEGRGAYNDSGYISSGKLNVRGFDWQDESLRLRDASLGSDYILDSKRISFPHVFAALLGGTAAGTAEVVNWTEPTLSPKAMWGAVRASQTGKPGQKIISGEQQGSVRMRASGMSLAAITGAISSRTLPVDRMNLVGTVEGTAAATWKNSLANAVTEIAATVTPRAAGNPNELPTAAELIGTYNAATQRLEISRFDASTLATHVSASGILGAKTASLRVSATSSNLGELTPIIATAGQPGQLPIEVHGQAAFTGDISGNIAAPTIAGHIRVSDFDSVIVPGAVSPHSEVSTSGSAQGALPQRTGPVRRMHWDELSADVQYSPEIIAFHNAVLGHGAAKVNFDFSASTRRGQFTAQTPFSAQVIVRSAQVSDLQTLAGYEYPVSGTLNLTATVSGTEADPHGSGNVQIVNATVYGQPIAQFSSKIQFANHEAQFIGLEISQKQARVSGSAAYTLTTRAFRFNLRGTDFHLGNLKALNQGRVKVSGVMNFTAEGSGTPQEPSVNAKVVLTKLVVNGEAVGDINAQAHTSGDTMTVLARSNFGNSDLLVDGTVRLRDDYPASFALRFNHLDLDPLLGAYIKGRLTGHSEFAGNINVQGALRQWRTLNGTGDLSQFYIPVENIEVRNQGPIRFALTDRMLRLEQFHIVAEDTDLTATGTAQLAEPRRLNLAANGQVNLKIIQSFDPNYTSYGQVAMNVRVRGTIADPILIGELQVTNAGISYIDLPNGLSDISGRLVFNSDRLQIQTLTGRTGGGSLNMTGYITYARTIGFNIQAVANDIRLRYPPGVSAMADANVRLTGTLQNSLLSGDVTITRFGLNPRFDFAQYLARSKQPPEIPNLSSPLSNLKLDIHVTSTPELQVQTSLAKLSGNVDMRLRGTALHPAVLGRVVILEGDIFFNGTKYRLERGDITFTNPTRVEPVLDIEAATRVRDYDITLGFHGPIDKLSTTYRSDPPLGTSDIIALLAFGRTREETALQPVSNQNFTETASNAILGQALNATVSSRVQKLFGVSRIKIDPQVGGAENNPSGARVTIEQQVANDLTITYITDLARSNQQIISVEYNVSRSVSLVAVRDQFGIVSFDVRVRQRKR